MELGNSTLRVSVGTSIGNVPARAKLVSKVFRILQARATIPGRTLRTWNHHGREIFGALCHANDYAHAIDAWPQRLDGPGA